MFISKTESKIEIQLRKNKYSAFGNWTQVACANVTTIRNKLSKLSIPIFEAQIFQKALIDFKTKCIFFIYWSVFINLGRKKNPQYWKTKKFFKNQGFCFQPVTTANDGVQSDMERAYRFSIFAENLKVLSLNTFWEKTWTSKKIKSLISRDREWQSTIGQYFKNIYLWSVRYKRFINIGYSVFLENVTKINNNWEKEIQQ